jgi:hypothetical protein
METDMALRLRLGWRQRMNLLGLCRSHRVKQPNTRRFLKCQSTMEELAAFFPRKFIA